MIIDYRQLETDSTKLAVKIPKERYKSVFGIPSGGILPGYIVCKTLGLTLLSVEEYNALDNKKDCLVVDDLVDSGTTLAKYPNSDHAVIYKKPHSPEPTYYLEDIPKEWVNFPHEKEGTGVEEHIIRLMEYIGENPNREGLKETPKRVIKMYDEIFRGYKKDKKPKITVFENEKDGIVYDQVISDTGSFYSHCEHHMVPFFGKYYFAYLPDKKIVGLSKVARIVDYYSAKLQIQERLVKEIVDALEEEIQPLGIALAIRAEHLCKTMRGAKKKGEMSACDLRGVFKTEITTKQEFLSSLPKQK